MVHHEAHRLVDAAHQCGDVSAMKLVCLHHLAGVALRPEDAVLKDSHAVWVLQKLLFGQTQKSLT